MGLGRSLGTLRSSYLTASVRAPENWIALVVTAGITLAVAAASRVPLSADVSLNLSEIQPFGGSQQATLLGIFPGPREGITEGPIPGVILNRPLPESFELFVDGRCMQSCDQRAVEVEIGESTYEAHFGKVSTQIRLRVANPGGARQITFNLPPGMRLAIRRILIRVQAGLG